MNKKAQISIYDAGNLIVLGMFIILVGIFLIVLIGNIQASKACEAKGMELTNDENYCYRNGDFYLIKGVGAFKFQVSSTPINNYKGGAIDG